MPRNRAATTRRAPTVHNCAARNSRAGSERRITTSSQSTVKIAAPHANRKTRDERNAQRGNHGHTPTVGETNADQSSRRTTANPTPACTACSPCSRESLIAGLAREHQRMVPSRFRCGLRPRSAAQFAGHRTRAPHRHLLPRSTTVQSRADLRNMRQRDVRPVAAASTKHEPCRRLVRLAASLLLLVGGQLKRKRRPCGCVGDDAEGTQPGDPEGRFTSYMTTTIFPWACPSPWWRRASERSLNA